MTLSIVLAIFAVLFYSAFCVLNRACLKEHVTPSLLLVFTHLTATIILFPTVGTRAFTEIFRPEVGLIAVSCVFWGITDYLEAKAYQHISAATSQTIGVLSMILVTAAGIIFFGEQVSFTAFIGMAFILISVIAQVNPRGLEWNRGVLYRFISVFFLAAALIFDKYNATEFDSQLVPFYGFLFTTIMFLSFSGVRVLSKVPEAVKNTNGLLLAVPLAAASSYWLLIQALSLGYLSVTFAIQESGIVFIFLLEYYFLKARDEIYKKAITCSGCAIGAALVTLT